MRVVRKDLARMLTVARERELAAEFVGGEANA
jgi:ribosomal protein L29